MALQAPAPSSPIEEEPTPDSPTTSTLRVNITSASPIHTPAQLTAWRQRLFALETPLLLSPTEYTTLWPLVSNIWLAQKRSPDTRSATGFRTIYLCRAGKAVKPTPKENLPPDKKRRNRKARSDPVECKASMKYTPLADGRHLFERRGAPHGPHGVGESDRVKRPREVYGRMKAALSVDYIALGISAPKEAREEEGDRDLMTALGPAQELLKQGPGRPTKAEQKPPPPSLVPPVWQRPSQMMVPQIPQAPMTPQTPQAQAIYNTTPGIQQQQLQPQLPPSQQQTYAKSTPTTHVALTPSPLPVANLLQWAKHPFAGAVLMFMGTTRAFSKPEGVYAPFPHGVNGAQAIGAGGASNGMSNGMSNGTGMNMNGNTHSIIPPNPYAQANTPAPTPSHPNAQTPAGYAPIQSLAYTSYPPLALKTLHAIATSTLANYNSLPAQPPQPQTQSHDPNLTPNQNNQSQAHPTLLRIAIAHRLGPVAVGEESVIVVVSGVHRAECWRAGEQVLEEVKKRAEVWKWEIFGDQAASGAGAGGGWRSNGWDDGVGRAGNGR